MKKYKLFLSVLGILVFMIPSYSFALVIFETTEWVVGTETNEYEFIANQSPYAYKATLTDLSIGPTFGFDDIDLSISTTSGVLAVLSEFGNVTFDAVPDATHFASVSAVGGGDLGAGIYGLLISNSPGTPVPEPTSIFLIGAGLLGLACIKRKTEK